MPDSISPFVLQCLHFTIIRIPDYWAWSERSHSLRKENYIRRQQCITAGHSLANRKKKKKTSTQIQASRRNTRHRQDMAESVIATNCFFLLRVCIGRTTLSNECLKNFKKKKRGSSESTQKFELWRDNSQALKHSKYAHRQCRSLILPILEAAWNQNGGEKKLRVRDFLAAFPLVSNHAHSRVSPGKPFPIVFSLLSTSLPAVAALST